MWGVTTAKRVVPVTGRSGRSTPSGREHEQQGRFARHLPRHRRDAVAAAAAAPDPVEGHGQLEDVAGDDLRPEPSTVDPAEQRQAAREAGIGQHGDRAELREGFHHQHARQGRPSGKVPGEEGLFPREPPPAAGRLSRNDLVDLVDEEERRPVWEHVSGVHGASTVVNLTGERAIPYFVDGITRQGRQVRGAIQ